MSHPVKFAKLAKANNFRAVDKGADRTHHASFGSLPHELRQYIYETALEIPENLVRPSDAQRFLAVDRRSHDIMKRMTNLAKYFTNCPSIERSPILSLYATKRRQGPAFYCLVDPACSPTCFGIYDPDAIRYFLSIRTEQLDYQISKLNHPLREGFTLSLCIELFLMAECLKIVQTVHTLGSHMHHLELRQAAYLPAWIDEDSEIQLAEGRELFLETLSLGTNYKAISGDELKAEESFHQSLEASALTLRKLSFEFRPKLENSRAEHNNLVQGMAMRFFGNFEFDLHLYPVRFQNLMCLEMSLSFRSLQFWGPFATNIKKLEKFFTKAGCASPRLRTIVFSVKVCAGHAWPADIGLDFPLPSETTELSLEQHIAKVKVLREHFSPKYAEFIKQFEEFVKNMRHRYLLKSEEKNTPNSLQIVCEITVVFSSRQTSPNDKNLRTRPLHIEHLSNKSHCEGNIRYKDDYKIKHLFKKGRKNPETFAEDALYSTGVPREDLLFLWFHTELDITNFCRDHDTEVVRSFEEDLDRSNPQPLIHVGHGPYPHHMEHSTHDYHYTDRLDQHYKIRYAELS